MVRDCHGERGEVSDEEICDEGREAEGASARVAMAAESSYILASMSSMMMMSSLELILLKLTLHDRRTAECAAH